MSANRLLKINSKILVKALVLIGLLFLIMGNIRVVLENILKSRDIDSGIISEANPTLNRNRLKEANEILEKSQGTDLTAISPSVTVEKESTAAPQTRTLGVAIENASGITGAAANLAEIFKQKGYQVSAISTAPSLQGKTTVFYKVGLEREAQEIKAVLEGQQWTATLEQTQEGLITDIRIVLGKK